MRSHLTLLVLPLLVVGNVFADIIHIPDDFRSIRTAIRDNGTQDGDTILIDPGNYRDTIDFAGKDITVASRYLITQDEEFIAETVIDGGGSYRVVLLRSGETADAKLIGLTITNGRAQWGGGIYISGSSPTLSHLVVTGNVAISNGGGIYATSNARPILDRVTIFGNEGESYGAMNCYNGASAVISNSIVYGNTPTALPEELEATYCDIETGWNGDGNIDQDPSFVNADEGDFHLSLNSGCIDAGNPDADPDPDGSRCDMGAFTFTHIRLITVNPLQIDFGELRLNRFNDRVVRITNPGAIPLHIESISIPAEDSPYSVISGGGAVTLESDDVHQVSIRFLPVEPGNFPDSLIIVSDAEETPSIPVILAGVGLDPSPDITIDRQRIDFGEVGLRNLASQHVVITNDGDAALIIDSVQLSQENSPFAVDFGAQVLVQQGSQVELAVTFESTATGDFANSIRIYSNDQDEPEIELSLSGTAVLPQRHYQSVENTGVDHSMLILSIEMDGSPLVYGSEVGIFTNNDLCCGGDYWLGERLGLAAWGDNEMTDDIDGWRDGEGFSFKVWDLEADEESIPDIEIAEGDEVFRPNGLTILRLSTQGAQAGFKVYITNGWSILSAPVIPPELNIVSLFAPVVERNHLLMIKDYGGRFYNARFGYSNLQNWDFRQGYQVRGLGIDSLDLGDDYVAEDTVIPLRLGWNIIAYFPAISLEAEVAFSDFTDQINIVKDAGGRFYYPARGYSNLPPLRRGSGYQIRTLERIDFVWHIPQQRSATIDRQVAHPDHFPEPAPTGLSMSVLLTSDKALDVTEIAAISSDGKLIGAAKLEGPPPWGMAVWGDDIATPQKDGASHGEAVRLLAFDGRREYPIESSWDKSNSFHGDGLVVVDLISNALWPDEIKFESPQPNPFNNQTVLSFSLPEDSPVKLTIYDLNGREVSLLINSTFKSGLHRQIWDASGAAPGIYIARLEAQGRVISTKLTLLR